MGDEFFRDLSTLLAVLSPMAALIFGYFSFANARKKNDKEDAAQMTTVLIKLESISENVKDIKNDLNGVKQDLSQLAERLAKAEAKVDSAHRRLDAYIGSERKGG